MPELAGLAPEGLGWVILAALVAGLVRGFTGFGSGLVFMPVAAQVLPPFGAIMALTLMDILGPVPNLRRAWGDVDRSDLGRLLTGCLLALPIGMLALTYVSPSLFALLVSLLALAMLGIVALGLRYRGAVSRRMVTGIGGAAGALGGVAGLPGPAVILFYMARPLPVQVIRATILLFLFAYDLALLGYMAAFGRMELPYALLGLVLALPNLVGNLLGAWLFRPERERIYRAVAYGVIALAALSGLPIWG